uniref:ribose-5-phosphate isomerase n=1 Tax=Panagrellus redivivus TaxID=6233 RepID=A0A7E4W1N1_PANRE
MRSSSVRVYHQVARTILGGHNSPTSTSPPPSSSAPVAVIRRRASSFCCSRSLSMSSSCSSISSIGASVASDPDSPVEHAKKAAAFACGDNYVKSGQKIGVGSGSTVKYFVQFLRERVRSGQLKDIQCVPTSFMTRRWLIEAALPVVDVEQCPRLDICIDGADEVDENLDLIKGGGGCLTQEKIVQSCADVFVVIADANKKSTALGDKYKVLPIEVVPVAYIPVQRWITEKFGGETHLRISSTKCSPLITDNNNYILEWHFPKDIPNRDWAAVHAGLVGLPGVVETGLFVGVTSAVYFAEHDGSIEVRKR